MPDAPIAVLTAITGGSSPASPVGVVTPVTGGSSPASPVGVLTPVTGGSAPASPVGVVTPVTGGSAPASPVSVVTAVSGGSAPDAPMAVISQAASQVLAVDFADSSNPGRDGHYVYVGLNADGDPVLARDSDPQELVSGVMTGSGMIFVQRNLGSPSYVWSLEDGSAGGWEYSPLTYMSGDPGQASRDVESSPAAVGEWIGDALGDLTFSVTGATLDPPVGVITAMTGGSGSGTPTYLYASGIQSTSGTGIWANGTYTRVGDVLGFPCWERLEPIAVPLNKMRFAAFNDGVQVYALQLFSRPNALTAWSLVNPLFGANDAGTPWNVTYGAEVDESVLVVVNAGMIAPPCSILS